MPKIRTHIATAKRIKITGTGKIMIGKGFQNHKKAAKSKRSLRKMDDMTPAQTGVARRIRVMVPGLKVKK